MARLTKVLLQIAMLSIASVSLGESPSSAPAPRVPWLVGDREADAGSMPAGVVAEHVFRLVNTRGESVRLIFKGSDCGCTTATDGALAVPGATCEIVVKIKTDGRRGPSTRKAVFQVGTDEKDLIALKLSVDVGLPLLDTAIVDMGSLDPLETRAVHVRANQHVPWHLTKVQYNVGKAEPSFITSVLEGGHDAIIPLKAPADGGEFKYFYTATFVPDGGGQETAVTGAITGEVANPVFNDSELFLGVKRATDSAITKVFAAKLAKLDVTGFEANPLLKLEVIPVAANAGGASDYCSIRITTLSGFTAGMNSTFLTYDQSSREGSKKYRIPVRALVLP